MDNNFYLEILEHTNIGIFVLDGNGNYLYVNDHYCGLLANKTREFYMNSSIPKLKEQGYFKNGVWEQVLRKNAPVVALLTITDKDSNQIHQLFVSGAPTFNNDGSIKYIFFIVESMENLNQRVQAGILNTHNCTDFSLVTKAPTTDIIAESPMMKELLVLLANVSKTDASILIVGPTGSGKEVLAEYAHRNSLRSKGPFISVDCASIPETLLESELLGYEKGAFTGASTQGKMGLIESANGGTLFLDEINSMPLGLQGKLLRVLETRTVKRLGSLNAKPIDFRLLCASNENLETLARNGNFRSDLYYRISVVPIHIPPLRERKEDIVPLAFFYLQYFCKKYTRMKVLSEELINTMLSYDWPGNVRELKNFIERIVVTSSDTDLQVETIPKSFLQGTIPDTDLQVETVAKFFLQGTVGKNELEQIRLPFSHEDTFSHRFYMEQCEKQLIQHALSQFKTPAKVAEILKLDLSNVYRKMRKYNL
ncbi:sigma-54 interaction domain-containing protein [Sporomusa termitida]|nr:sigma 54-interacting transcriptional regulator [Sporomusa termitida]